MLPTRDEPSHAPLPASDILYLEGQIVHRVEFDRVKTSKLRCYSYFSISSYSFLYLSLASSTAVVPLLALSFLLVSNFENKDSSELSKVFIVLFKIKQQNITLN
jgi:hypothetical protein